MTQPSPGPVAQEFVAANAEYAQSFDEAGLAVEPSRQVAVVICMDARVDPYRILGLDNGQAHVIRNGGGVLTDDVLRSLVLSQRALGTTEIVLVHHSGCGLQGLHGEAEESFLAALESETGQRPAWGVHGFADAAEDVRKAVTTLSENPFLLHTESISGYVYDVQTGRLDPVT